MPGDKAGDGTNSPFGNGAGDAEGGGGMGNDFVQNPGGTPGKTGGGQPASYGEHKQQRQGADPDINAGDMAEGGKDMLADDVQAEGEEAVGTGSVGNARKPFKGMS